MLCIVAYYLLTSTCIGLQDSFYITAGDKCITVIPTVEWKPKDRCNNRQLWYKGKPRGDGRFAIYADHEHKQYLDCVERELTLTETNDDENVSCFWKHSDGRLASVGKNLRFIELQKSVFDCVSAARDAFGYMLELTCLSICIMCKKIENHSAKRDLTHVSLKISKKKKKKKSNSKSLKCPLHIASLHTEKRSIVMEL